ncbi:unnamed protein product [Urochloa humidicola]
MPNPLCRPAAAARREASPGSQIGGSVDVEVDGGVGCGGSSASGRGGVLLPGGRAAAGDGVVDALPAQQVTGAGTAAPGGPAAGPSTFPTAWSGDVASAMGAGMIPGMAAMAGVGSSPDWWNSAAALGPDWLANVLAAAMAPASTSIGMQLPETGQAQVEAPIQGGPSRRRGGRGGRAPRPSVPVRAARRPSASFTVDLTDPIEADWCDENNKIACEIFADEVQKGNRETTHLSKTGYTNLIKRFKERTGLLYTRKQFKNRWDKLKSDYGIWKELNKETGLGWDETGKNIVMTDAWWKLTAQKIKGCTRFKNRGLQNEDELEIMFEDLRNTGDDHWCASSGVAPSQATPPQSPIRVDDEDEAINEEDQDSEADEVTPTIVRGKRGRGADNSKAKKPKTSGGHWFHEQMGKLVYMNERTTASCESIARRGEGQSGSTIQDVMALVKECGAVPGTNEHFIASLLFTKQPEREMFLTMDTPQERFDWLTRKHEYNMMCMTRNGAPQ